MDQIAYQDSQELRQEIIRTCLEMSRIGYCISTWGNISVRLNDGSALVTPTRMDYADLTPADIVNVDLDGKRIAGCRLPSSETLLHCALLKARPDVPFWIHTHAPNTSALACQHVELPVFVEDQAQIIGGTVRCARYAPGGHHQELADVAVEALDPDAMAVLLANHGVIVGGRSLAEALVATRVLEKAAAIWLAGPEKIQLIPEELVKEERYRFIYKYGKE